MAKAPQHTVTVSSAGIQGPVSIQLQSPGRMVQGAQGQLATLGSTVKQQQASRQQGDDQQEAISAIVLPSANHPLFHYFSCPLL